MPRLEALHQEPGRFGREDLNHPGRTQPRAPKCRRQHSKACKSGARWTQIPGELPTGVWQLWWRPCNQGGSSRRFRRGKWRTCLPQGTTSLRRKRTNLPAIATGKLVFATLLPQMIVSDVLLDLGQIQQQRSRRPLPLFYCRHQHRMCPSRAITRLAQAVSCSFSCVGGKKEHAMERP